MAIRLFLQEKWNLPHFAQSCVLQSKGGCPFFMVIYGEFDEEADGGKDIIISPLIFFVFFGIIPIEEIKEGRL